MCLSLRNTESLGFSVDPNNPLRTDHFRRSNRLALSLFLSAINHQLLRTCAGERLARLDLDHFTFVPNSLALVRLGLARLADFTGKLPDQLLVRTGHVNLVRAFQCHI